MRKFKMINRLYREYVARYYKINSYRKGKNCFFNGEIYKMANPAVECGIQKERKMKNGERSVHPLNQPVEISVPLVIMRDQPVEMSVLPVKMLFQPVGMIDQPVKTKNQPVGISIQPVKTSVPPVKMLFQPVGMVDQPVKIRNQPVKKKNQPVEMVFPPVNSVFAAGVKGDGRNIKSFGHSWNIN